MIDHWANVAEYLGVEPDMVRVVTRLGGIEWRVGLTDDSVRYINADVFAEWIGAK